MTNTTMTNWTQLFVDAAMDDPTRAALAGLGLGFGLALSTIAYRTVMKVFGKGLPLCTPPGRSWLWGHERAAFEGSVGDWYLHWFEQYGPAFKINAAIDQEECIVLADPAALNHIYIKKNYDYPPSAFMGPFVAKLLGKSIIWAQGQTHVQMRRLLNPAFSEKVIKQNADDIADCWSRFEAKLVEKVHVEGGHGVINAAHWMRLPALDIIGRAGFNYDFGCGESDDAKGVWERFDEYLNGNLNLTGLLATNAPRFFPAIANLPIPALQTQQATKKLIHRLGREMFSREKQPQTGNDLLSILMRQAAATGNGTLEPTEEMLDHVNTFVLAGHETISMSVAWAMWCLACHPEQQRMLRDEVRDFQGTPTYDDLNGSRFPYLDAVTKESLRLYPPAGHVERVAMKDDVLPLRFPVRSHDGSYIRQLPIKAGQAIIVSGSTVDRLSYVWGPDAEAWRPERWLDEGALPLPTDTTSGWARIFAFSQGPRSCIGLRLAVFEYKFFLFQLLRTFKLHDTGAPITRKAHKGVLNTQPFIIGREAEGTNLPIGLTLLD
ncbi:cytochrome P450 [Auriculariales sp. MPI-PUGE-AT-0066]|nr:cytochrome P450 [Auriculariales sp. MPI-PUGE-AT-0066]